MLEIVAVILLFLSIAVAAVFVAGAALFCIGGHWCWEHIQLLKRSAPKPVMQQASGPYRQGFQAVEHQDDATAREEDVEEWLSGLNLR